MNDLEKELLFSYLRDYSDRLGNDGCNDELLPATQEAHDLILAAEMANSHCKTLEEWKNHPDYYETKSNTKYCTNNFLILDYLTNKLKDILNDN